MSIEAITCHKFSAYKQPLPLSEPPSHTRHDVFHYFFSDYRKHFSATTAAHIKRITELLNNRKIIFYDFSTICNNTYSFTENYRCATVLFLLSILSQSYNIIIYCGLSEPVHGREVFDVFNTIYKRFLFQLM